MTYKNMWVATKAMLSGNLQHKTLYEVRKKYKTITKVPTSRKYEKNQKTKNEANRQKGNKMEVKFNGIENGKTIKSMSHNASSS